MATSKIVKKIYKDGQEYLIFGSGGASIEVDSALSDSSENPVQNKVVKGAIDAKITNPSGGSTGQILKKTANGEEWADESGGFSPENEGTEGQVLTKTATGYAFCDSQGGGDTGPKLDIMVVGGGGAGGGVGGGGGGGGAVKKCIGFGISGDSYSITIGIGGLKSCKNNGGNGGSSCFTGISESIESLGGGGGGGYCGSKNGGDGGNGGGAYAQSTYSGPYGRGGIGYQGYQGGISSQRSAGGGGGAGGPGSIGQCSGGGGAGGQGIQAVEFKPGTECCLFGTGGNGGGCNAPFDAFPGGGKGGGYNKNGSNATYYGGGGGGGGGNGLCGGDGCQGIVIIKYPTDGSYGIASSTGGDNCYTCDGYCYVEFTQNGTFTPTYS